MPMGPDPNPNTASAIGPATMARLEHGPLETRRRPEGIRGQNGWGLVAAPPLGCWPPLAPLAATLGLLEPGGGP